MNFKEELLKEKNHISYIQIYIYTDFDYEDMYARIGTPDAYYEEEIVETNGNKYTPFAFVLKDGDTTYCIYGKEPVE